MANASKDPYWLATVRSEVELEPELREVIEKKCATCHMPMAEVSAAAQGGATLLLDEGFNSVDHSLHNLARDGVSCTLCHQVEADNFGQPESFGGGFMIDLTVPNGSRFSYGPYQVGRQLVTIMQSSSGYIPQQGAHLSQSELCGTCHNLVTPFVDTSGQVAGEFSEQAIYSEWENSAYPGVKGCMDCHMPAAAGALQLSITGGPARTPFSQHVFAGGNAFIRCASGFVVNPATYYALKCFHLLILVQVHWINSQAWKLWLLARFTSRILIKINFPGAEDPVR